jgi:hypothetical protein
MRKYQPLTITLLLTILLAGTALAQSGSRLGKNVPPRPEYHGLLESFFTNLEQQKPGGAIDYIYDTNLNLDNIKARVADLRARFIADMERAGQFQQYVVALERQYGGAYAYLYVIAVCDLQPVKMEFHFYKPKQRWRLHSFSYSRHLDRDISEILKYELITGASD